MTTKTSAAGRAAIEQREGCRFTAYRDSRGVLTIGVGHTGRMSSPPVMLGMTITREQADAFLTSDLAPVEAAIAQAVKVPTTQNQHDAMASLGFNVGAPGLIGSTVIHKLNAGDVQGAADAFLMWERPPELKARREAEREQFLASDDPALISSTTNVAGKINKPAAPPVPSPGYVPPIPYHKPPSDPPSRWDRILVVLHLKKAS